MRADGDHFLAEATLSSFELAGQPHYTLIFRDIEERLEAEQRIRALMTEAAYLRAEVDALRHVFGPSADQIVEIVREMRA